MLENETPTLKSFSMTAGSYRQLLRESAGTDVTGIQITEIDKARLENLIALEEGPAIVELEHELERAVVVKPEEVARNVVTMNSKALLQLDDEEIEVALVYPEDADSCAGKYSVCSDIGAAILGYQEETPSTGGFPIGLSGSRSVKCFINRKLRAITTCNRSFGSSLLHQAYIFDA